MYFKTGLDRNYRLPRGDAASSIRTIYDFPLAISRSKTFSLVSIPERRIRGGRTAGHIARSLRLRHQPTVVQRSFPHRNTYCCWCCTSSTPHILLQPPSILGVPSVFRTPSTRSILEYWRPEDCEYWENERYGRPK